MSMTITCNGCNKELFSREFKDKYFEIDVRPSAQGLSPIHYIKVHLCESCFTEASDTWTID